MLGCAVVATAEEVDLVGLAQFSKNRILNKYDELLPVELLCIDYASRELARLAGYALGADLGEAVR